MDIVLVFALGFLAGWMTFAALKPWLRAASSGVRLPLGHIIGMSLRGTPVELVSEAHVMLTKRGHPASIESVEASYMAFRNEVRSSSDLVRIIEEDRTPS